MRANLWIPSSAMRSVRAHLSGKQANRERRAAIERSRRIARTQGELVEHLRRQIRFLVRSADAYDQGDEAEAQRLAVVVRTLVHDTRVSRSLFVQLGLVGLLEFVDTARAIYPGDMMAPPGLVQVQFSTNPPRGRYIAGLGDLPPDRLGHRTPFSVWWSRRITRPRNGVEYSRADMVLAVANREGGAHVDPLRDPIHQALVVENGLGWRYTADVDGAGIRWDRVDDDLAGEPMEGDPLLAAVRQVAYELSETVSGQLSAILPDWNHEP
jgi:hypothetical protein